MRERTKRIYRQHAVNTHNVWSIFSHRMRVTSGRDRTDLTNTLIIALSVSNETVGGKSPWTRHKHLDLTCLERDPGSGVLQNLIIVQPVKKFPRYGSHLVCTTVGHWSKCSPTHDVRPNNILKNSFPSYLKQGRGWGRGGGWGKWCGRPKRQSRWGRKNKYFNETYV